MISRVFVSILLLLWSTLIHAESFIDDSDSVIQFSTGTTPWNHKTASSGNNSADITKCYDKTYSVNQVQCKTEDACHFQIPFTGSGITIYVIQSSNPLNASLTLDGNSTTDRSIIGLPAVDSYAYNLTLYDVQSLAYAHHTLDVALIDFIYDNGTSIASMIRFDYAAVNDTTPDVVAPVPSVSPAGQSGGASSHSSSKSIIGPAVGGAVGGVALIALVVIGIVFFMRRKRSHSLSDIDSEPKFNGLGHQQSYTEAPLSPHTFMPYAYTPVSSTDLPTPSHSNQNEGLRGSYQGSQVSTAPFATSTAPPMSGSSVSLPRAQSWNASTPSSSLPPGAAPSQAFMVANPSGGDVTKQAPLPSPVRPSKVSEARSRAQSSVDNSVPPHVEGLSDEQARFVANLHQHNVPAAEIARLMDVMRRERVTSAAAGEGSSSGPSRGAAGDEPPPSYDFVE